MGAAGQGEHLAGELGAMMAMETAVVIRGGAQGLEMTVDCARRDLRRSAGNRGMCGVRTQTLMPGLRDCHAGP